MYDKYPKLKEADVKEKTVLLRAGFDIPLDKKGRILDDSRIIKSLPTINYLLKKKAKVVIISHNGRPNGKKIRRLNMDSIAKRLTKLLKRKVKKLNNCVGPAIRGHVSKMRPGEIVLLENLRFHKEEKENNTYFAEQLAELGEVYINDSFPTAHRDHASMTGVTQFLPSYAGLLMEKEIENLKKAVKPKKPYIAMVGGAKPGKIKALRAILKKANYVLIGGVLANTMLKAKGVNIQSSKYDKKTLSFAKRLEKDKKLSKKIILPVDAVVANKFDKKAKSRTVEIDDIPKGWLIMDIGPKTIKLFKTKLKTARTITWMGPIGVFEMKRFEKGTKQIAQILAESKAVTIIGGGDSAEAVNKLKLAKKMDHVSTGGGASLMFLSGKILPAISALKKSPRR